MTLPVKIDEKKRMQQKDVAVSLVLSLNENEKINLQSWCVNLIEIKNSSVGRVQKIKDICRVTSKQKIIFPVLKAIYQSVKKYAWEDRSTKSRLGLAGLGIGATFFAGQSAGIAALGSAIGVPLWIVFGAGGTFAGFIIEEVTRSSRSKDTIIEASYTDVTNEKK